MSSNINFKEAFKKQEVKDYTYAILFFVVSSFFAVFVIRPVISIAISLQKEAQELEAINKAYERNITHVLEIQSDLENIRPRRHLLEDAFPSKPNIKGIISDFQNSAQAEGINLNSLSVGGIQYKDELTTTENSPKIIQVNISFVANFAQMNRFIRTLVSQRRIKNIRSLSISRAEITSGDEPGRITLVMDIEVYYL